MSKLAVEAVTSLNNDAVDFSTGMEIASTPVGDTIQLTGVKEGASAPYQYLTNGFLWGKPGAPRYYYNGAWLEITSTPLPAYQGDRGIIWGNSTGIFYVTISTPGNATSFGTQVSQINGGSTAMMSDSTYAVTGGGLTGGGSYTSSSYYVTIATAGNSVLFGYLSVARGYTAAASNGTRGIIYGGTDSSSVKDRIDYFTIATPGNATTFGTIPSPSKQGFGIGGNFINVFGGQTANNSAYTNVLRYVVPDVLSNGYSFGALGAPTVYNTAAYSRDIALIPGGTTSSLTTMFTLNITTNSDAVATAYTLTVNRGGTHATSNYDRGIFAGGYYGAGWYNTIDYIDFASLGNAADFGDLTSANSDITCASGAP